MQIFHIYIDPDCILSVNLTLFFTIQHYTFCLTIYLNTISLRVTKMLRLLATDIHTQIRKSGVVR